MVAKKTAVKKSASAGNAGEAPNGSSARKSTVKTTAEVAKAAPEKKTAAAVAKKSAPPRKSASKSTTKSAKKATAKSAGAQAPAKTAAKDAAQDAVAGKAAARKAEPKKAEPAKKAASAARKPAKKTGAKTVAAKKTPGGAAAPATAPGAAAASAVPKARTAPAAPGELAVRPGEEPWTPQEVAEARAELGGEAERLRDELLASEEAITGLMRDSGDGAGDDQADTGTKNITREHELALAANAREMLLQTERAMERLDAGTYGLCESCGNPIGKARMQAFPRATLCVDCKQKQERRF
ncbi:TraR/DksA C4-type zinc finger protein [Streptomyces pathocidini]|uniref:TraR/DksA C4-type zinc finger protein n=1 Tax=Streptomyces pathocidini TaxID=1650571 RepID=A0ABW7V102_9ACTN|nr:TraR/DksA C4-type zinc finger protein [Streptomyces pathocidini]